VTTTRADALAAYLEKEGARVERALLRALAKLDAHVPGDVAAAARHGVLGGGKRLPPISCVAAYQACGGGGSHEGDAGTDESTEAIHDLAASLELIHAYSLMHDDLPCMDDGELRRGQPTTHRVHGEDLTMRAGAALIPAAALHALATCARLGCSPEVSRSVAAVLLTAAGAGGMVGGQWLDLESEGHTLGGEALDDLHARKTGALLAASLEMGALAAGAPQPLIDALREYGRAIGLAFQITDDVLDATQSAETLGKNPSDAAHGKSTYVVLHGLEEARRMGHAQAERAVGALASAGLKAPMLEALARYVVEREK
jgi:geranylgeranyl pyrophosphate synthase